MIFLLLTVAISVFGRKKLVGRKAKFFKEAARFFLTRAAAFFFGQTELRGGDRYLHITHDSNDAEEPQGKEELLFTFYGEIIAKLIQNRLRKT